ncbi:DNPH1 [Bugula neritina]|uniref:DNPH1 n=1 Tax=Bugula neritina TaxID=10212 RepID=A0A7J7JKY3_BUGNE|nr:DNPH1 [Bugula neritina]
MSQIESKQPKIYFCGSIRAGRGDVDLYNKIIQKIDSCGAEVLTEFVGWSASKMADQNKHRGCRMTKIFMTKMFICCSKLMCYFCIKLLIGKFNYFKYINCCGSYPTLPRVGYELGRAQAMGKKILCLYRPQPEKQLSAMIRGQMMVITLWLKIMQ